MSSIIILRMYVLITSLLLLVGFSITVGFTEDKTKRRIAGGLVVFYIIPIIYLAVYT